MDPSTTVAFRPLSREDLPLVSRWLATPYVARWWTDRSDPASVEAKYGPRIDGEVPTEVFVIVANQMPIGLIQRYRTRDHPDWQHTLSATGAVEGETAGIDYLIGEAEMVGRGVGTRAIREFTKLLFKEYADVESVIVAPQQANPPSWRALESSGYTRIWAGILDSNDSADAGPAFLYRRDR
jgi:aminoglycoside 6'-N-acetyltransferase